MAEPEDFGNQTAPSVVTIPAHGLVSKSYPLGDLPAGATIEFKLTVGGQSQTKTLTVPPNKTATGVTISVSGKIV